MTSAEPTPMVDFLGQEAFLRHRRDDVLAAIDSVLASDGLLGGRAVEDLEAACARRAGRRFAVAVNSATDALMIALRACGVGRGDEVIVTAFSFIASASSILLAGATPVFVDIDPRTYLMDLEQVPLAVSPRTKAIVAVQLYGQCLPASALMTAATDRGLIVVEDAAQAFGSSRAGRVAGSVGRVSVFSFDPSKVVGGVTTGGMLLTDDSTMQRTAVQLRSHGWDGSGGFAVLGYNSRMSSLNAAVVARAVELDAGRRQARRFVTSRYLDGLEGIPNLTLPVTVGAGAPNYHKFVVRSPYRDALRRHLSQCGIETRVHYAQPLPETGAMRGRCRIVGGLPEAAKACREVLSLPMHAELTDQQVQLVIGAVRSFFEGRRGRDRDPADQQVGRPTMSRED